MEQAQLQEASGKSEDKNKKLSDEDYRIIGMEIYNIAITKRRWERVKENFDLSEDWKYEI